MNYSDGKCSSVISRVSRFLKHLSLEGESPVYRTFITSVKAVGWFICQQNCREESNTYFSLFSVYGYKFGYKLNVALVVHQ